MQYVFFQDTDGKIDLTKLFSINSELRVKLTRDNLKLRRDLYIAWANSEDQFTLFQEVTNQLMAFAKKYCIKFNSEMMSDEDDILYTLLDCHNIVEDQGEGVATTSATTSVEVKIQILNYPLYIQSMASQLGHYNLNRYVRRSCYSSNVKTIRGRHLFMHNTVDSSSTSEVSEDDLLTCQSPRKRRRLCQITANINYDGQLDSHRDNITILKGAITRVDVLILCHRDVKTMTQRLARYLGLIFIEDVIEEMAKENPDPNQSEYDDLLNLLVSFKDIPTATPVDIQKAHVRLQQCSCYM